MGDNRDDVEKNIEIWKTKMVIKSHDAAKGNETSVISLMAQAVAEAETAMAEAEETAKEAEAVKAEAEAVQAFAEEALKKIERKKQLQYDDPCLR